MAIKEDKSGFGSPSKLGKSKSALDLLGETLDPDMQDMMGTGPTDGGSGRTYSRKSIAEGMKRLSKQGGLTPERIEEARGRAAGVGVSDELFDKYMKREGLGEPKKPFGAGFGGSSGFGKAQPLDDRKSLFFRREARRARKKGYGGLAQDLYGKGIMAKMTEPTIMTQDYKDQQLRQRKMLAQSAQEQDELMSQLRKNLLAKARGGSTFIQERRGFGEAAE